MVSIEGLSQVNIINSGLADLISLTDCSLLKGKETIEGRTTINIEGSSFEHTMSGQGLLYLDHATMTITNSLFLGNFAELYTNGFNLMASDVKISKSTISNSVNKHDFPLKAI